LSRLIADLPGMDRNDVTSRAVVVKTSFSPANGKLAPMYEFFEIYRQTTRLLAKSATKEKSRPPMPFSKTKMRRLLETLQAR
jgi:hypothetical protein